MNSTIAIFLLFVVIQQFLVQSFGEFNFRPKYFKIERATACKPALNYRGKLERFDLAHPIQSLFLIDADIRFLEDVTNPIQFQLTFTKCSLENVAPTCDDHEYVQLDDVCNRLADKNAVWTPLVKLFNPKLACPIKKGLYTIRNGTLDLGPLIRLPIDGFKYITEIALYEISKNFTHPLQLLCLESDVSVSAQSKGRERARRRG